MSQTENQRRDEFTEATKRAIAQRAGGRCSYPGCDKNCWLPGVDGERACSIGVAAHIKAAARNGPRYDPDQTPEDRRSAANGIFLCQVHAHQVDADSARFSVELLLDWKIRHEEQIIGIASGNRLFPEIRIERRIGLTIRATEARKITSQVIGNSAEHALAIRNSTDFDYLRIGFSLQYPEFIEHPPTVTAPPGFSHNIEGENMEWEVSISGGGSVDTPKVTHYGSFTLEGSGILPGQSIELLLRSIPDPLGRPDTGDPDLIYYWICGEVTSRIAGVMHTQQFTAPLSYSRDERKISVGYLHATDRESLQYMQLRRCY